MFTQCDTFPTSLHVPRQGGNHSKIHGNLGKIHTAVSGPLQQGTGQALVRYLCPEQKLQGQRELTL